MTGNATSAMLRSVDVEQKHAGDAEHGMRSLRVLAMMHPDLIPPDDISQYADAEINAWKTEYDVVSTLEELGHEVQMLGIADEVRPLRESIQTFKPHIVFNLLEEFRGEAIYDQNVVAFLELLGVRYTGCNPRGLFLSRGKALSKKILTYHRIRVPKFFVYPLGTRGKRSKALDFPLIVKSASEDASVGISQASIVHDEGKLAERVGFIHERIGTSAIAEQFIEGRDVYVPVLGNRRLTVLPPQELVFEKQSDAAPKIATEKAKHDVAYQRKWGIDVRVADLDRDAVEQLAKISKRIYRVLQLQGYARIDYRLDSQNRAYFLEANANPDLARYEELANAAESSGIAYEKLIQMIVNLGLRRP